MRATCLYSTPNHSITFVPSIYVQTKLRAIGAVKKHKPHFDWSSWEKSLYDPRSPFQPLKYMQEKDPSETRSVKTHFWQPSPLTSSSHMLALNYSTFNLSISSHDQVWTRLLFGGDTWQSGSQFTFERGRIRKIHFLIYFFFLSCFMLQRSRWWWCCDLEL